MKLFRSSGQPIKKEEWLEKLNEAMDEIESRLGKANKDNVMELQAELSKVDDQLAPEFPVSVEIEFPKTVKKMKELLKPYGAVAFCLEDDKLVAYILDQ